MEHHGSKGRKCRVPTNHISDMKQTASSFGYFFSRTNHISGMVLILMLYNTLNISKLERIRSYIVDCLSFKLKTILINSF